MEEKIAYLESERQKLWEKITEIQNELEKLADIAEKKTSDYEEDAKESALNASSALTESTEIKNQLTNILEDASLIKQNVEKHKEEIEGVKNLIQDYHNNSKSDSETINEYYENVSKQVTDIEAKISTLQTVLENKPQLENDILKITEIFDKANDYDSRLKNIQKTIADYKKEIDEVYFEIFGFKETDEQGQEVVVEGLKHELEESYYLLKTDLKKLQGDFEILHTQTVQLYEINIAKFEKTFSTQFNSWGESYNQVLNRINELLPNALTTGLSFAYSEKKNNEIEDSKLHSKNFTKAIWGLIGVSLIPFSVSLYSLLALNIDFQEVIMRIPRIVLAILPIYLPVLWLAYSANRKLNLSKRLIEEYSHKEVLSKTFEGLSLQIQNINNKDISNDLRNKLLYNILEVNSENPGKLISDYDKTDHPLMDALEKSIKLTNAVTKLSKIPGFNKLANSIAKKSESILGEENKKATTGIEMIESKENE